MPRFFATDSGGVERLISRFFAVDSGGTTRQIQRAFVIDSGGTARLFFVAEVITLSGTSGSPNMLTDLTANIGNTLIWHFLADGTVNRTPGGLFNSGVEWSDTSPPSGNYWLRATINVGMSPNDPPTGGDSLNTWLALSSDRDFSWTFTGSNLEGSLKVEIARDASGSDIVATGFYGAQLEDV